MIEIKNVSFHYKSGVENNGISNINLSIKEGEVVLLCGESGCGKTTITRLINGLVPHFYEGELTGEVLLKGNNIIEQPLYEISKSVGSVFQNPRSQFFNLDTTSELAFGCENLGLDSEEIEARVNSVVSSLNLDKLLDRNLFHLSGGEKQKIACGSIGAYQPDVFVLDEPSSNLDKKATDELREFILKCKKQGKTVIIAEHRIHFLKELVDRVIFMKDGQIEEIYDASTFLNLSNNELEKQGIRPLHLDELCSDCDYESEITKQYQFTNFHYAYKKYEPTLMIDQFHVDKGSVIALIGNNGAGKSTLARCICGLEKSCKGILEYEDSIRNNKQRLSTTYMVMQDVNHQLFTESVLDEVLLSMNDENKEEARQILQSLDLEHLQDLHPMSLSGGEKQRVAIASAIAANSEFVIFDEPTSGLDLRHMQEVAKWITSLQNMGKTSFVITHDPELILKCCTHVMHMSEGKIDKYYELSKNTSKEMMNFFLY